MANVEAFCRVISSSMNFSISEECLPNRPDGFYIHDSIGKQNEAKWSNEKQVIS